VDDSAFLAAILARPDDDAPRLVWADALDEVGDPRGEFVRAQCELARLGPGPGAPCRGLTPAEREYHLAHCAPCRFPRVAWEALRRRERELLDAYEAMWVAFLPESFHQPCGSPGVPYHHDWEFRRGFVEEITCAAADWLGGPCGWCEERGHSTAHYWDRCPACIGTGHTPGHADDLIAACPLRRVRLTTLPTAHVPEFNALRDWKKPLEWGGDLRDSLAAQWPGIAFELPATGP
jgi:uncharacterized protein (TIGR02996 family)